jgi:hypothetical protein
MLVNWRLATLVTRLSTLVMRDLANWSPPTAETEIGTDCRFSDRLAAVTTISPGADALSCGGGASAARTGAMAIAARATPPKT